jgi:hypothetical protein
MGCSLKWQLWGESEQEQPHPSRFLFVCLTVLDRPESADKRQLKQHLFYV